MKKIKHWLKYRRIHALVERAARNAFYMQHWGRAHNLYDRLDRMRGIPPQHRLLNYRIFKLNLLKSIGHTAKWQFDPYTLS